jgi:multimeric flavodoxin WrbA
MKVMGFNGSPRKGNTRTLIEAVLKGAEEKGAQTQLVNLNEGNIRGCQGCDACKNPAGLGKCVQKDDLSPLLQEMTTCDALVLGTPIYYYHATAQFRAFTDRLYCFLDYDPQNPEGMKMVFPGGKKIAMVTSRGDFEKPLYMAELFDYFEQWLEVVAQGLAPASVEYLHHYESMNLKDSARNDAELMARAASMGAALV